MHYTIVAINPAAHLFHVTCHIPEPTPSGQVLSLPSWIPGSYMIREFAKNIVTITASCGGQPVVLRKLDKSTWQAAVSQGPLEIEYEVYAWDLSVRSAHLDTSHGYFNGTSVFLQAHDHEHSPVTVDIRPPAMEVIGEWRLATSLVRDGAALYGFGRYRAENYDDLIDHPVEMSAFTLASFEAGGVPHDVVITGRHQTDMERLCRDLKTICEAEVAFFGELPKMERYLFLVLAVGEGYGGLEHRASCSLICSRNDLPQPGQAEISEGYRTFLGLCSHEYFHTWNVKRIKPEAFVPYQLDTESYTRQLWAFEGITSYYDDLLLRRGGLLSAEVYLQVLAQTITRVWRGQGRFKQSVADSSFDAWTKFYRQDENAPNAIVSYYTKGSLIALALDLTIRQATQGERSLDDVMQRLWLEYGKPGIGVPEGEIERIAGEVAGCALDPFFEQVLYGTADPDLKGLLATVGVEFVLRPAIKTDDKGGNTTEQSMLDLSLRPVMGVKSAIDPVGAKLANVFSGGAAEKAGLAAGDVIIAVNGLKVSQPTLEAMIKRYRVGDELEVHAFRRDELMTFNLKLQAAPFDTVDLLLISDVDAGTLERRKAWLCLD